MGNNKISNQDKINSIKEELGLDYKKALSWWHIINPHLHKMDIEDYISMNNSWRIINALSNGAFVDIESNNGNAITVSSDILFKTYALFKRVYENHKILKPDISDEEMRQYISDGLNKFRRETQTEKLVKEQTSILKSNFSIINFDDNNNAYIDSRNASIITGKTISINNPDLVWVESSEDGISRILQERGLAQITINMDTSGATPEEEAINISKKEKIFLNGIYDIATGKHYMCSAPSASSTRKAEFPFVEADTQEDIYSLWLEITGFKTMQNLLAGIGHIDEDGNYVVNFAKLKARIAMRGANSLSVNKISQNKDILDRLKNPSIDYTRDAKGYVEVPYKTIEMSGCLTLHDGTDSLQIERV